MRQLFLCVRDDLKPSKNGVVTLQASTDFLRDFVEILESKGWANFAHPLKTAIFEAEGGTVDLDRIEP